MRFSAMALAAMLSSGLLYAQFEFKLAGRKAQVHSFASQGFAYSNGNNYMTMDTSRGSFAMSDGGVNIGVALTDRFRVGAQLYARNLGKLGNWRPTLDWAFADYRVKDWFGVRGGKVKTVLGLHNDTQDMEFLHTWALMPTSVYPMDVRGDTIAHVGGDLYGNITLPRAGSLGYTVYGGRLPNDMEGGYVYGLNTQSFGMTPQGRQLVASIGKKIQSYNGPMFGADLKWNTPLKGLLAGASLSSLDTTATGYFLSNNYPYKNVTLIDRIYAFYTQYSWGNAVFEGEYRKENRNSEYNAATGVISQTIRNSRQGYLAVTYRLSKRLELGTYHSRFLLNWDQNHGDDRNHIFDQAVTARVDLNRFWDLKIEGHFMDGAMVTQGLNRGFYVAPNPQGLTPQTRMLVIRTGFHM